MDPTTTNGLLLSAVMFVAAVGRNRGKYLLSAAVVLLLVIAVAEARGPSYVAVDLSMALLSILGFGAIFSLLEIELGWTGSCAQRAARNVLVAATMCLLGASIGEAGKFANAPHVLATAFLTLMGFGAFLFILETASKRGAASLRVVSRYSAAAAGLLLVGAALVEAGGQFGVASVIATAFLILFGTSALLLLISGVWEVLPSRIRAIAREYRDYPSPVSGEKPSP